jgi:drug/metabolite transporter (DMT)-like permease
MAINQLFYFYLLKQVPISVWYILFNTGPIFAFIFNVIFYNQHSFISDYFFLALCFAGVISVTSPELIFGVQYKNIQNAYFSYAEGTFKYILIGFAGLFSMMWAFAILVVKRYKNL